MWKLRSVVDSASPVLLCFFVAVAAAAQGSTTSGRKWQTLTGNAPLVIARGGFSGVFPDSSSRAYQFAVQTGLANMHVWCDVKLTRDAFGICFPNIRLENSSDIANVYSQRRNTYTVNGVLLQGWFPLDFTLKELASVHLQQGIYARTPNFDGTSKLLSVDDVVSLTRPAPLWLNIPYATFFGEHNLSMRSFLISASRLMNISCISSPEIAFLRSISPHFKKSATKLVFQFIGPDDVEPSTNQTYSSLVKNLAFIKTFAAGILVPKNYIWPVDRSLYLHHYTSLVLDAHAAGLEVFAYNFMNDVPLIPYDYSYDPVAEVLSFIDNGKFSVDGVLSDFPLTPSAAIDCFSHLGKNDSVKAKFLILSSEGASGVYPGCTDLAYTRAVSDGVDILDCPVQMTKDGIPFCLGSINLKDRTNVAETKFSSMRTSNPDLNISDGIFTYDLTWNQIQRLKPAMANPFSNYILFRNPRYKNRGKLMQLSEFLSFASNSSSLPGVLISIENASYLAAKQGLHIVDKVLETLRGYKHQAGKRVVIKSSDRAVLEKFKSYERSYIIKEDIDDILINSTISEIKKFASSVVFSKKSVLPTNNALFLTGKTAVVPKLHSFKIPVYVQFFHNEFVSQAWDFLSDPYVEIDTFVSLAGVDGVVTDHPATAAKFRRNRCLGYEKLPPYMTPVQPGSLLSLIPNSSIPTAAPPPPPADVVESLLPYALLS
ncbi:glycerophosphodiester phosphodiesterase GDPDL4-like [Andrographis paniculata]|uniref:glycerophosphodiester phosphodiesterase GDPDL4-like n=1 Tax=Andrographis paniculata TaxID=175694 RepID=UPI0021E6F5AB|nr:glycerophosphodiester phosphodiesterase GDPDL4-like [Andrographis paniculata]